MKLETVNRSELDAVRERYARRSTNEAYSLLMPYALRSAQEKERALVRWVRECGIIPLETRRLIEVGCGRGNNLIDLLRLGFLPENLVGNELLEHRAAEARSRLPDSLKIVCGDSSTLEFPANSFDIVLQSTVFTSLLDDAFQERLASHMWELVKPGGGVLWYDFTYNNPSNPDVRGVPLKRIRSLFPEGSVRYWRVTLAPPIGRRVTKVHPALYGFFNLFPFLRTHVLCWIRKAGSQSNGDTVRR